MRFVKKETNNMAQIKTINVLPNVFLEEKPHLNWKPNYRLLFFTWAFFLVFSIFCTQCFATQVNVFIDPSAQFNGDGTSGQPAKGPGMKGAYNTWKNIKIRSNHNYYQRCGTIYQSSSPLSISVNGTEQKKITFGAYYLKNNNTIIGLNGNRPIIENLRKDRYTFFVSGSKYIRLENLDIKGGYCAITIQGSNNIDIENCIIGNVSARYGILVTGKLINGKYTESNYGRIKDCIINPFGKQYGLDDGIKLRDGANFWDISDNLVTDWGHDCINLESTKSFYTHGVSFNKIHHNLLSCTNKTYCRGFETWGSKSAKCEFNEIYRNIIKNTTVRNQINGNNNMIHDNIIDTVTNSINKSVGVGQGLDLEGFGNCVCENNEIYNNIIYNCDEAGIRVWIGKSNKINNKIYNNIIYNCGKNSINGFKNVGLIVYGDASVKKLIIKNNCIFNDGTKNNLLVYYRGHKLNISQLNNSKIFTQDEISGNLNANPLFVDPENGNFSFKSTSPCKKAGLGTSQIVFSAQDSNSLAGTDSFQQTGLKLSPPQNIHIIKVTTKDQ